MSGRFEVLLVEDFELVGDVEVVVLVRDEVLVDVVVGDVDEKNDRQRDELVEDEDDQLEVGRVGQEVVAHLLADLEDEFEGVLAGVVVRLRGDVELEGRLESLHGVLGGVDGLLDGLSGPVGRLAEGAAVVQTVAD